MNKLLVACVASLALPSLVGAQAESPVTALQRDCDAGRPDACHELAGMYSEGDGAPKDAARASVLVKRAYELYLKECETEDGVSCWVAGMMLHEGEVPKDLVKETALFQRSGVIRDQSCTGGDASACFSLAAAYAHPDPGFDRNPARATLLYGKACALGHAGGCQVQGSNYERGDGVARDAVKAAASYKRAAELYLAACDKGEASACAELGYMHREGQGMTRDNTEAIALMQRACASGYEEACWNVESLISWIGHNGNAIERRDEATLQKACDAGKSADCISLGLMETDDDKRKEAIAAFEKACNANDGLGCRLLAIQHQYLAQALYTRAAPMIEHACDTGNAHACQVMGAMASHGEAQPLDRAQAKKRYQQAAGLYEKACNAGDVHGCESLAMLLIENLGTLGADPAKVVTLRQKACDGGFADACFRLGLDHYRPGVGVAADPVKARALVKQACDAKVPSACDMLEKMK